MFMVTTFSSVVAKINSYSASSGITAVVSADNKLRLSGAGVDLKIENYATDLSSAVDRSIGVQKVLNSNVNDEIILPHLMTNTKVGAQIEAIGQHFVSKRFDLGVAVKTAQNLLRVRKIHWLT